MPRSHPHLRAAALGALSCLALTLGSGCGRQPQVASQNREIVVSLVTAVSARNSDWLDANAQLIEKRKSEGQLSDAEYKTFTAIVSQARAGDWKAAETAAYALREGQEPTAEDIQKLAERKLAHEPHKIATPPGRRAIRPPRPRP